MIEGTVPWSHSPNCLPTLLHNLWPDIFAGNAGHAVKHIKRFRLTARILLDMQVFADPDGLLIDMIHRHDIFFTCL